MNTPEHFMPISQEIWQMKYQAEGELTVKDTWKRIAKSLASVEKNPDLWETRFYNALSGFKFLPAGRITANAGLDKATTLSNCFVMGTIPDSLEGIFDALKEAALTMQQGGGIGYDFSTIRPKGAMVKGVAADASGPLSFMDVWDTMCKTIMSAGGRRGAMMATMRCDHPDIIDFVTAKRDKTRLRHFNVSVLVTDEFMYSVKNDLMWYLHFDGKAYDVIRARELWDLIMENTYNHAEPGVIFIDRVNQDHNLNDFEIVAATNPCGEKPMAPYSSCLLGSINLAALIENPFLMPTLPEKVLRQLVRVAIRMMDNVIDLGRFPLPAQASKALEDRQLGLGITGLADALFMMNVKYGSNEAAALAEKWMEIINDEAYLTSAEIASEKGSFTLYDPVILDNPTSHVSTSLRKSTKEAIRTKGLRNSLLTSIAPTGTISLYANNVSSGMEPVFAGSYNRRVLTKEGEETWQIVEDYGLAMYREHFENTTGKVFDPDFDLPNTWVTAQELKPIYHVKMQAALQKHIDSSISKTVNVPKETSFEDFKDIYMEAYDSGCKGCTTYRPNDVTGAVLEVTSSPEPVAEEVEEIAVEDLTPAAVETFIMDRPEVLESFTYKMKWQGSPHALYITISDIVDSQGVTRPFEIFISTKHMDHFTWTSALTRMISAVFRRGGDVSFVYKELQEVFDPKGGAWMNGKYVPSILAAIGNILERHMKKNHNVSEALPPLVKSDEKPEKTPPTPFLGDTCPSCGSHNYVKEGGCSTCKDCGHSGCS